MLTLFDFSRAISKLNTERKYSDALKYFKQNKTQFTSEQISGNEYLISAMITALRKINDFDNAFRFLDVYNIRIDNNTKEIILTAYGWLLYSKFKSENQINDNQYVESEIFEEEETEIKTDYQQTKSEIIKKIELSLPLLLKINNDYAYSVVSNLFTSVLKAEKKKTNTNWKLVNEFCDLIPLVYLNVNCRTIEIERKGRLKSMELASDRETWYSYKSKALMKLGRFEECYEISKKALELFQNFHYSNDVWFARRIALSKKNLGNLTDAISELEKVLNKKNEWFIQKELAVLYQEYGDNNKAFDYAIEAINNFGDLEYKVDLLFFLGELLTSKQENDLAFKHFSLCQLIRIKEEWTVPSNLQLALGKFENPKILIDKLPELKSELKKYWNSCNQHKNKNTDNKFTGKIIKILHNDEKGADGFIKLNENKSVYFKVNMNEEVKNKLDIGLEVEFKILPAINDKKEKAIQLKILKDKI